ncbi:hypothetical protein P171DRAFT_235289 [Karstenula rhodostoma CBS 690.94]|uniref:RING-type domain-containing protein n=1 Tax=Karstenula rhodostoma CBS 690.94 TaxID=1392251 RepID=A0A9P4PRD2_9PLEO|nr:hypothetical protein P171DRAFT_235289 [Karstenula rhodostoma CBS 690.94]
MDFVLRCNDLKCRSQLRDQAVVTTCSHAFCTNCAESTGLSRSSSGNRTCPACHSPLVNPADVVVALLNPAEDYKTSVLSGLSPTIIMECAGRALTFYTYQATQEVIYQEYMAKSLTEQCATLNQSMDDLLHQANNQIKNLQDRLKAMQEEHASLEQSYQELDNAFREKTKTHQRDRRIYESLKAQVMATQVANAAGEEVNHTMHSIRQGDRFIDKIPGTRSGTANLNQLGLNQQRGGGRLHNRAGSGSSGSSGQRTGGRLQFNPQLQSRIFGGRSNTSQSAPVGTPHGLGNQSHRSQIPVMGGTRQNAFNIDIGPPYRASPTTRQPLTGNLTPRNRNVGLAGGASKRDVVGNIGHLGR